ncbi:hypothetical protein HCN44_011132 [Aphidius gifuensis]|uniref:TOG domain-containing protein n=1 Tax=Aphidius gifuensis TaxID=684658 RepID=A0A834XWU4_APHGI|nr:hypothetical protein HCN44_011132 [Aphidius gifuensis]
MSGCVERCHQHVSPMTGSIQLGPIQPHAMPYSKIQMPNFIAHNEQLTVSPNQQRNKGTMTLSQFHQKTPIQLTPLWEHVVRTQEFPSEVDKQLTFDEITERLRDPEWEVRQHALRVLIDVLPTLKNDAVDDLMVSVVPELVNNLGHLAPAVRKGGLDALRVYLVCSQKPDDIVNNILEASLKHHDIQDSIKTSITAGVILSTPSLLFSTLSNTTNLTRQTLKLAINYLANYLVQVTHQESALKSLVKIRDTIGNDEFINLLNECDPKYKIDFENICQDYDVNDKSLKKKKKKKKTKKKKINSAEINENNNNDNVDDNVDDESKIPPSRVVLETEIKFNSETAIMMTILEEKNSDSDDERENNDDDDDDEDNDDGDEYFSVDKLKSKFDDKLKITELEAQNEWIERRKTPRRVHFGGEIVKLRTPDSDDSDVIHQTKIPLPITPVTKMPLHKSRVSSINKMNKHSKNNQRRSRSASSSPKRKYYIHDASLSPKKSILTKTNDYEYFSSHQMNRRKSKSLEDELYFKGEADEDFNINENDRSWSFEVFQDTDNDGDDDDESIEPIKIISDKATLNKSKKKRKLKSAGEITTTIAEVHNEHIKSDDEKINEAYLNDHSINDVADKKNYLQVPQIIIQTDKLKNNTKAFNKHNKNDENLEKRPNTTPGLIETIDTSFDNELKVKKKNEQRSQSSLSRKASYEAFPKKERNYIYMELSSPAKVEPTSREVSPSRSDSKLPTANSVEPNAEQLQNTTDNKIINSVIVENKEDDSNKNNLDDDVKIKSSIVAEKKSSDDVDDSGESRNGSSDSGPKLNEENWEELGLVNQEVLDDLHNKVRNNLKYQKIKEFVDLIVR